MTILDDLSQRYDETSLPIILKGQESVYFADLLAADSVDLSEVKDRDVVALIGDFDPVSINTLLQLMSKNVIIVPLTVDTRIDHDYFMETACVDVVIEGMDVKRIKPDHSDNSMLTEVFDKEQGGLILFSSGTTGRPKAILHSWSMFLGRYQTPRPGLKTVNFLLFDHIGGINTLLHTLYNKGQVIVPEERTPTGVLKAMKDHGAELLPTSPTFIRLLLMAHADEMASLTTLKLITYGTEMMDDSTLSWLARVMPDVGIRQTYGMSELGILRIRTKARDSRWMEVGGEGVEIRVVDNVLQIKSESKMIGYMNAPSPFDKEGWYDTKDIVEVDGSWLKITGRTSDVISIGGIKVLPEEIERAALLHSDVILAKAIGKKNPITGQHIELLCQLTEDSNLDKKQMKIFLQDHLQASLLPQRIKFGAVDVGHRFKKK